MPADIPDFGPKDIVEKGHYILDTLDMFNILKYDWTVGVLLPLTAQEYQERRGITADYYEKIQAHCKYFKDTTYPSIVKIASNIYDYAGTASGGDDQSASYYAMVFDGIRELARLEDSSSDKATGLIGDIKGTVQLLLDRIPPIQDDAKKAITALHEFGEECKAHHVALEKLEARIREKIAGEGGEIEQLQKQIKTDMQELLNYEEELRKDYSVQLVFAVLPSVPSSLTVDIISNIKNKHKNMEKAITELNEKLKAEKKDVQEDRDIVADLTNVKLDIQSIVVFVEANIKTIEKIIGVWDVIKDDLSAIKVTVQLDKARHDLAAALTPDVTNAIIKKWADAGKIVNAYRKGAYISEQPKVITLNEYATELAKEAEKH
ncbi:hypothetical protein DFH07DRAFT_1056783 [Mycena maculata]|uniref:Uncharacterized protein n=1 Tax=Mycena maculata TaxID=230809 RepID=A0AAD7K0F7_9AGAR|nr:hypothetical protein DFH07DRAFT_1056783 [Mycena maculata]